MSAKPKPDIRVEFGDRIKDLREDWDNPMTQKELAEEAGVNRSYLAQIENGKRNVSLINIEKLAAGLDVSIGELFNWE